ncbi:hypothetical protein [Salisaeta longa]|uniref:hypothetical protein n=1 Tax=Salisaeta longa TaxID=503170 RepID=UPI0003B5CCE0|nr:hypothetical protein [Salisaeta longa]
MAYAFSFGASPAVRSLGIIAVDVGFTLHTGTVASAAGTQRIAFAPEGEGIVGWMARSYALVRALLLCCRAVGLSYYAGSVLFFVILLPVVALGCGAIAVRRSADAP